MFARSHGETPTLQAVGGQQLLKSISSGGRRRLILSTALTAIEDDQVASFGFMFAGLADDPAHRLPEGADTIKVLKALGEAMASDPSGQESDIPAAYTYFGQFIDHDITKTVFSASVGLPGGRRHHRGGLLLSPDPGADREPGQQCAHGATGSGQPLWRARRGGDPGGRLDDPR